MSKSIDAVISTYKKTASISLPSLPSLNGFLMCISTSPESSVVPILPPLMLNFCDPLTIWQLSSTSVRAPYAIAKLLICWSISSAWNVLTKLNQSRSIAAFTSELSV